MVSVLVSAIDGTVMNDGASDSAFELEPVKMDEVSLGGI